MIHPVDRAVGARLRQFRRQRSLTQAQLGGLLGLTFQQVQKYEHARSRISASKLMMMSDVLGVSIEAFFEDVEDALVETPSVKARSREEASNLAGYYSAMPDTVRQDFLQMVKTMANAGL